MIAPTAHGCKRSVAGAFELVRDGGSQPLIKREIYRHGIVSRIIILPNFRLSTALLDCDKAVLRWPGPFGAGFLSPQPPGVVRIGPVRKKHTPILGQRELVLFLFELLVLLKRFRAKACPALDAGWIPRRVNKTRQNRRPGSSSASPDRARGRRTVYASDSSSAAKCPLRDRQPAPPCPATSTLRSGAAAPRSAPP
jgi:hypothetical protein